MKVVYSDEYKQVYASDPASAPGRIEAIEIALRGKVKFIEPVAATEEDILKVHTPHHIRDVEREGVIASLAACDTGVFRWRIEVPAAETLFQMDLLIQPGTLPGDFLGDHRIVSVHFPAATYEYRCGDVTADGQITVADVTYLVAYLFRGDPAPVLPGAANVNGESGINVADVAFLIAYLFRGGPAPEACP